ncbi:MAG: hypothetical protein SFT68_00965, partial [Rickettsiaceae bacterium]|nr:hypothetical protein [Rickettsiaceae bacterium]
MLAVNISKRTDGPLDDVMITPKMVNPKKILPQLQNFGFKENATKEQDVKFTITYHHHIWHALHDKRSFQVEGAGWRPSIEELNSLNITGLEIDGGHLFPDMETLRNENTIDITQQLCEIDFTPLLSMIKTYSLYVSIHPEIRTLSLVITNILDDHLELILSNFINNKNIKNFSISGE